MFKSSQLASGGEFSMRQAKVRCQLFGSAAVLIIGAVPAWAQEKIEEITVSSSRIQSAGFNAPTPITVLSAADLEAQAKPNIFDAITQLPALQGSTGVTYNAGSTSTGLIGLSAFALRGLSALRTLVLLDGQRVVGGNFNGVVDVSQLPQLLIKRADVVTGGASASWGSDAVAGVVNIVTDKKFEGFKFNAQSGLSTYGDAGSATVQLAAGTSFAGGRGHFEGSAEYSYNDGLYPHAPQTTQYAAHPEFGGRNNFRQSIAFGYSTPAATPAGSPQTIYGPLAQQASTAPYGLITSGPKNETTFTSTGVAQAYNLAGGCTISSAGVITGMVGGTICFGTPSTPGDQSGHSATASLVDPITRGDVYMRLSFDLTPTTEVYATLNYGASRTMGVTGAGNSQKAGMTLRCDNAYLPSTGLFGANLSAAATQAACLALYPGNAISYASQWENIPNNQFQVLMRTQRRYVVGGDGSLDVFGKTWTWESYVEHGESDASIKLYNEPLSGSPINPATGTVTASLSRFNMAQDAVFNASGNIVCRNAVAQLNGCVPFNPFGATVSQSAIAYFDNQNGPAGTSAGPSAIQTQRQEAFSFSVNGAPIDNWAGPVSVAFGYEYREEHYSQRGDPYGAGISASTPATVNEPCTDPAIDCGLTAQGSLGAYNGGNFHNGRGTYHINEAFLEVDVPLLNDAFWGKADLNIAGRHARYSTAGDANTWKVGATWDTPIPGIRVRALQSRDIRAPNLSELYAPASGVNGSITNDFTGVVQAIRQNNVGNLLLKPEKSQTTQVGIVWQPDFIPGFQASVDYYRIGVKGAIAALSTQNVEDLCFNGNQLYCQQDAIQTANGVNQSATAPGGPAVGVAGTVANQLTVISSKAFNTGGLLTDGFDIEASYRFDLEDYDLPGSIVLRSLTNHTSKFIQNSGIPNTQQNTELAGYLGNPTASTTYNQSGGNVLTWKLQETQNYQNDGWGVNLTERWFAGGTFTAKNTLVCAVGSCPVSTIQTPTANYNKVSSIFYLDVGANWNVGDKTQLYAKVDNVTNIAPPDTGSFVANNTLYDVIGRMYRIGVRFSN